MSNRKHIIHAIIYDKRGRILSKGTNSYVRTHPLQAKCAQAVGEPTKIYLHAEISALIRLANPDKADKIVVFRFLRNGMPAKAAPCKCCLHALKLAGISKVEHT